MKFLKIFVFFCSFNCFAAEFETHLWPEEGRPVLKALKPSVELRETSSATSKIIKKVSVEVGLPIKFDLTRYRTLKVGHLTALKQSIIVGRAMGKLRLLTKEQYYSDEYNTNEYKISIGDQIEFLQYRAEGTCFIRIDGNLIDAEECPAGMSELFEVNSEPTVEWWTRVNINNVSGWVLVDGKKIAVDGRTY